MIHPRQLDAFVAVVRTGSTVAAARVASLSQPSVSRLIADLEHAIAMPLFHRAQGRLTLTQEGELFYAEVERYFLGTRELANRAREIRQFQHAELRVATIAAGAVELVPNALARLEEVVGSIRSNTFMRSHFRCIEMVATGQADFGFCNAVPVEAAVRVRDRVELKCVLALPSGHRLANESVVGADDIVGERFISLGEEFYALHLACDKTRKLLTELTYRKTNLSLVVCRMVAAGLGIGLIDPATAATQDGLGLVIRPFEPTVRYPVSLIETQSRPISRLHEPFIATLREEMRLSI